MMFGAAVLVMVMLVQVIELAVFRFLDDHICFRFNMPQERSFCCPSDHFIHFPIFRVTVESAFYHLVRFHQLHTLQYTM